MRLLPTAAKLMAPIGCVPIRKWQSFSPRLSHCHEGAHATTKARDATPIFRRAKMMVLARVCGLLVLSVTTLAKHSHSLYRLLKTLLPAQESVSVSGEGLVGEEAMNRYFDGNSMLF